MSAATIHDRIEMSAAAKERERGNRVNQEQGDLPASERRGRTTKRGASHPGAQPPVSASLGNGVWQTASWTDPESIYQQDLHERTCTCMAGEKGLWCKHLTAAFIASLALQVKKARAADGVVVRGLLNHGTHQGRPDIEMALLLVAWEEAKREWGKLTAEEPGDDPEPAGGVLTPMSAAERFAAVALLSEGRIAA